jgi:hypothetical protein
MEAPNHLQPYLRGIRILLHEGKFDRVVAELDRANEVLGDFISSLGETLFSSCAFNCVTLEVIEKI